MSSVRTTTCQEFSESGKAYLFQNFEFRTDHDFPKQAGSELIFVFFRRKHVLNKLRVLTDFRGVLNLFKGMACFWF